MLLTWGDNSRHVFAQSVRHEAQHAEDNKSTVETGQTVNRAYYDGIPGKW